MAKLLRIPPLAVGLGIYLPMEATLPVVVGAVIGWIYNRTYAASAPSGLGVLVASGMIVGESLFGVINAGLIVGFNRMHLWRWCGIFLSGRRCRRPGLCRPDRPSLWLAAAPGAQGRMSRDLFGHPRGLAYSVRHRDVGALFLLWDARPAGRIIWSNICCCRAMSSKCCSIPQVKHFYEMAGGSAERCSPSLADLRHLYRSGLCHAAAGRLDGGQLSAASARP